MALHDQAALDGFNERDPAERSAFDRLFYRNRRPTWFGSLGQSVLLLVGARRVAAAVVGLAVTVCPAGCDRPLP